MVDAAGREHIAAYVSRGTKCTEWNGSPVFDLLNGNLGRLATGLARRALPTQQWQMIESLSLNAVLRRAARQTQPDIVFVQFANLAVSISSFLRAFPGRVFVHCHGVDVTWDLKIKAGGKRASRSENYADEVASLSKYVTFLANSKWTSSQLQRIGVPENRIEIKYLGVPVPSLADLAEPDELQHQKGMQIAFVGRLVDCKGPSLCIQAFEGLADQNPKARLVMAGDGPMMEQCQQQRLASRHRERVELLGAVSSERVQSILSQSHIFTAHNLRGPETNQIEAYGVSILEAMAHRLPVVTGRSGGPCETVVDGETGILFAPGDVAAHTAALLALSEDLDLRRRMGFAGRQRVIDNFSNELERRRLRKILGLPTPVADPPIVE